MSTVRNFENKVNFDIILQDSKQEEEDVRVVPSAAHSEAFAPAPTRSSLFETFAFNRRSSRCSADYSFGRSNKKSFSLLLRRRDAADQADGASGVFYGSIEEQVQPQLVSTRGARNFMCLPFFSSKLVIVKDSFVKYSFAERQFLLVQQKANNFPTTPHLPSMFLQQFGYFS